jgi:hypothetical protein
MKWKQVAALMMVGGAVSAGALEVSVKDSDVRLQIYGYVKADFVYETQGTAPQSEFSFWVLPEVNGEKDGQTRIGVRESRLGLNVLGPNVGEWKTMGKFEIDFYGGGNPNSYSPRIRVAYVDLANGSGLSFRVGQDWETFIETWARVVNFGGLADFGALGLRRPQARVTQELKLSEGTKIVAKVAIAQTVGQDLDGGGFDDGADAELPTAQWNLALHQKLWTEKSARIAFSGHYGVETVDESVSNAVVRADAKDYDTWSAQGTLFLPLTKCLALQGNVWAGENLDTYYGAIGQGVNVGKETAIAAVGGWGQLLYDPTDKLSFSVGYSVDKPEEDDLSAGNRSKNEQAFVNAFYKINPAVTVMAEYAHMITDYLDRADASTDRVQMSVKYTF